ncbi:MAG: response regulator [Methanomicrobiales archaeon]|nr:response regulator [Methanomicrobiales archaeon]
MPEKRVLIVEDDEIIVRVLLSMLKEGDFLFQTPVNSGEQAILQVATERPDVVLMDIDLPGEISGIKTAADIFIIFTIPVIFVTGHDERKVFEKAISALPFGFLIKPVNPYLLYSTIQVGLSLCEKMLLTTEGQKAGLTPAMSVQISDSMHPVILVGSDLQILWTNQATEELMEENIHSLFLMDIREMLSGLNLPVDISPSFFREPEESRMPVSLNINGMTRKCIITAHPIMNMFGLYSGSFITIIQNE